MDLAAFDFPRYLATLPLFHEMPPDQLGRVAQGCRLRRLVRGEDIFHAGEPCNEFHVVVSGQVKLFAISPAGQEKIIELIRPGSSFAEALMFSEKPYITNAQALTSTLLLSVSKSVVLHELESDSRFCMRMLAALSLRLHGLVRDVQAYALNSGAERVIGYLLRELPEDLSTRSTLHETPQIRLPVSKAAIASRLSMTPEYFSRVLHELESRGLISIDQRDIRILDLQNLTHHPAPPPKLP